MANNVWLTLLQRSSYPDLNCNNFHHFYPVEINYKNERVSAKQTFGCIALADLRGGGARDARPPGGPNSFIFMQFSGTKLKNKSTFGSWRTPWGKSWIRHCIGYTGYRVSTVDHLDAIFLTLRSIFSTSDIDCNSSWGLIRNLPIDVYPFQSFVCRHACFLRDSSSCEGIRRPPWLAIPLTQGLLPVNWTLNCR